MNWKDITVSPDNKFYTLNGKRIFDSNFLEVLKFHDPGLAPVKDESGAYHIDINGKSIYQERYNRTFGYYCNRATVVLKNDWFHIDEKGIRVYSRTYNWTGNYQENICSVRDKDNLYFHIDINGIPLYDYKYLYAGDYKDNIACVRLRNKKYKHIDNRGRFFYDLEFDDLGVFHKNIATAKDETGWFHIRLDGSELYRDRYLQIEPFYNGQSLVTKFNLEKIIIDESGSLVIEV